MKTVVFAMHKKFMTHCMNDEVAMYVNINIDYYFSVLKQTNVVNVQREISYPKLRLFNFIWCL
jgi:hypothetical protein